jgi:hypothetical protein
MKTKIERRTAQGYKLRVYLDAIRDLKALSDAQWLESIISSGRAYESKEVFLHYLEQCALNETEKYFGMKIA